MSHSAKSFELHLEAAENARKMNIGYLEYIPSSSPHASHNSNIFGGIIFLHGIDERGTNDPLLLKRQGLPKLLHENTIDINFIVLSPQLPPEMYWTDEIGVQIVSQMLQIIQKSYNLVSPNHIYLTGLSMGGFGVWNYATKYPNHFAAYAPICGGLNPIYKRFIKPLSAIPLWVFHGKNDQIVDVSHSDKLVKHIRKYNKKKRKSFSLSLLKYTRYDQCHNYTSHKTVQLLGNAVDNQHDSWSETYRNYELYTWFLKHSLQNHQIIQILHNHTKIKISVAQIILVYLF